MKSKLFEEVLSNIDWEALKKKPKEVSIWDDFYPPDDDHSKIGTDESYILEYFKRFDLFPIGITNMICEETFIFQTKHEVKKAWELFKAYGWWYTIEEWPSTRNWYVTEFYDGD